MCDSTCKSIDCTSPKYCFWAPELQGTVNLSKVSASKAGLLQTSDAVNSQTKQFHTENDSTYTIVNVPKQEKANKGKSTCEYKFDFKCKVFFVNIPSRFYVWDFIHTSLKYTLHIKYYFRWKTIYFRWKIMFHFMT